MARAVKTTKTAGVETVAVEPTAERLARLLGQYAIDPEHTDTAVAIMEMGLDRDVLPGPAFAALLRSLPDSARQDARFMLLACLRAARYGRLQFLREPLKVVVEAGLGAVAGYEDQVAELARLAIDLLMDNDADQAVKQAQAPAILALLFLRADPIHDLQGEIRSAAFSNTYKLADPAAVTCEGLRLAYENLSLYGKAEFINLLTAIRSLEEGWGIVASLMADKTTRSCAHFTRAAVGLAIQRGDTAPERLLLARFNGKLEDEPTELGRARLTEVLDRRHLIGADRPVDVFVGVFGQARAVEERLPANVAALQAAFKSGEDGPFKLHFGLSTWAKAGMREVHRGDMGEVYKEVLPTELQPLVEPRFGIRGEEISQVFPALVEAVTTYTRRLASQLLSVEELTGYLPRGSRVVIGDEAEVEEDVLSGNEAGGYGRVHPNLNQFKMWRSISNLKETLVAHEARLGRRVNVCLFLRMDLTVLHGPIGHFACRAASAAERTKVFSDWDAHADFVEGAGDRYMMMSRDAAEALFDSYRSHIEAVSATDERRHLRRRNQAHEGLVTLLFQAGLVPHPVAVVHCALRRASIPVGVLKPAIEADLKICKDAVGRKRLTTALAALSGKPGKR